MTLEAQWLLITHGTYVDQDRSRFLVDQGISQNNEKNIVPYLQSPKDFVSVNIYNARKKKPKFLQI